MQRLAHAGIAMIIISDDLPELLQNCDRILLMKKGRIASAYRADELHEADLYHALLSEAA
jgi:simple sugar transport system ATP-binding protein